MTVVKVPNGFFQIKFFKKGNHLVLSIALQRRLKINAEIAFPYLVSHRDRHETVGSIELVNALVIVMESGIVLSDEELGNNIGSLHCF